MSQCRIGDEPALTALADNLIHRHADIGEERLVEFGVSSHGLERAHFDPRRIHREDQV